jgi:aspartyl-tRNA(Asn)/glutamyl-tRNA(Gln) amidotransferase subunit A
MLKSKQFLKMNKSWTDIASLQAAYKAGTITPIEVTKYYLDRIAKYNPKLNAFITVTSELAMDTAKKLNIKNIDKLPLFGVPVAFKDIYSTKDIRTTAGSNIIKDYIGQYDATVVKKYLDAGAIVLGKLNCDAFAHGSSGENSDFGPTKNPWNLEFVSGGSSGGSAAAVSADLCMITGGSDTGGSIRCPASFCSVVGFKPTYGRVSRYGIIAMASSLDSIGHFGNSVLDVAKTLEITAGTDDKDATSSPIHIEKYSEFQKTNLQGLKIGIPKEYLGVDADVKQVFDDAVKKVKELGAEIVETSLPYSPLALACYYVIQPAEVSSNLGRFDGVRYGQTPDHFGAEAKRRIELGKYVLSSGYYDAYYLTAQKVRTLVAQDFEKAFTGVDLILGPVMPHLPFKIGEKVSDPLALYLEDVLTVPVNLAGLPAVAVPCGFANNLPVGMQLIGPKFAEKKILEVANVYEQNTSWHERRPNL